MVDSNSSHRCSQKQFSVIGLRFSNWGFRVGCMGEAVYPPHHVVVGMGTKSSLLSPTTPAGRNGTTVGGPRTAARRPPKEWPSNPAGRGAARYVVVRWETVRPGSYLSGRDSRIFRWERMSNFEEGEEGLFHELLAVLSEFSCSSGNESTKRDHVERPWHTVIRFVKTDPWEVFVFEFWWVVIVVTGACPDTQYCTVTGAKWVFFVWENNTGRCSWAPVGSTAQQIVPIGYLLIL